MSSNKLSTLFNLPFIKSYKCPTRNFITTSKIQTFLGSNFYPRLNSIYTNLIEAIAKKNYRYLSTSFQSGLASQIMNQMRSIQQGRFKFRIQLPKPKLSTTKTKKFLKMLAVRQNIWDNGVTRIGLQCNVYFGQKFDRDDPIKINQQNKSNLYRIGQFRYIRYYPHLGLFGNIKNWYNQQTYELLIRYSSKMFLEIQNFDDINSNSTIKQNQEVITQVVMKTSHQKFDWVIVDINGMNKEKLNIKNKNNTNTNTSNTANIKQNSNINPSINVKENK